MSAYDDEINRRWFAGRDEVVERAERTSIPDYLDQPPKGFCNGCGRHTYADEIGAPCQMPQPDGSRCQGRFWPWNVAADQCRKIKNAIEFDIHFGSRYQAVEVLNRLGYNVVIQAFGDTTTAEVWSRDPSDAGRILAVGDSPIEAMKRVTDKLTDKLKQRSTT